MTHSHIILIGWQHDHFEFREHRCEVVVKRTDFKIFCFISFLFYFAVTNALVLVKYYHNIVAQRKEAGSTLQIRVEISIEHQVEANGTLLRRIFLSTHFESDVTMLG